jgi:putative FmdB family regulatory protein
LPGQHEPEQTTVAPGPQVLEQLPDAHTMPLPHTCPQVPQFWPLTDRSTQTPLHSVWPVGHVALQTPFAHTVPDAQTWPHVPQFCGSLRMSTQPPLQLVVPAGHGLTQTPWLHCWLALQALPHLPQLNGSLERFTQPPLQSLVGGGQLDTHELFAQTSPEAHTWPHLPQLCGSCERLTHLPEQVVWPLMQLVHLPEAQCSPGLHLCPHRPQLRGSVCLSTHLPWQRDLCEGHPHLGLPCLCFGWMQISPRGQHLLPHLTWCLGHLPLSFAHASPGESAIPAANAMPPLRSASRRDIPCARAREIASAASSIRLCGTDSTLARKYVGPRTDPGRLLYWRTPMPIYEYRCENDHTFEVMQRISDDPVATCEVCGAPVHRVFHPVAVHFKGSGFYSTDYGSRKRARERAESAEGNGKPSGGSEHSKSDSSTKSDSSSPDSGAKKTESTASSTTKSD